MTDHNLSVGGAKAGKWFVDHALAPLWLTWMLIAAIQRMIRWFPAHDAPLNSDAFWTYIPNSRNFLLDPWHFLTRIEDSFYVAPLSYIWPAVWNSDPVRIQLANCLLFLLSILLMWRLASRLGGPLAGMVSTALLVFYPDIISYVPQVLTESLYLFSILLLFASIAEYALASSHKRLWLALAALGLSLSLLSRPVLQIFTLATLVLVIVGMWLRRKSQEQKLEGWGLLINGSVAFALVAALALPLATVIKNGVYFQYWGLSTGAGSGLYYGVSPFKMGIEPVYGGYEYDASIVPKVADPVSKGHPLKPRSDEILSRAAISVIKNTTLADNARFFFFKLKAWLFFGQEELRMRPELRILRTFEWLAIALAMLTVFFKGFHRTTGDARLRWQLRADLLPNTDGLGKRRLALSALLLLLTFAMAAQLSPVLYNLRYNVFFLEPMLMPLSGVALAMLLRRGERRTSADKVQTSKQRAKATLIWLAPRLVTAALLAYVPTALTSHAKRHRAWAMDPLRPGPTQLVLEPRQMQTPEATNANSTAANQWTTTQRPAVLTIGFQLDEWTDIDAFMDGIWRLKLAVRPPHEDRNCTNVRMELTTPSAETLWYTPEPLIRVQADGNMHMYAIRGNGALRPADSGAIKLTFDCPAGTQIGWGNAQLLRVTMPQAARALIEDGTPINPYRADDIK